MEPMTTIKISKRSRDQLRAIAFRHGYRDVGGCNGLLDFWIAREIEHEFTTSPLWDVYQRELDELRKQQKAAE